MEFAMNTSPAVAPDVPSASALISKRSDALKNLTEASGRVLLAVLFLLAGIGKLGAYAATGAYMSAFGVPSALLPVVIATEVLGALAILLGWKARVAGFLLAGFCLLTASIFHHNLADQAQLVHFFKDLGLAGGLLLLVANGAGPLSLDRRFASGR
jgi:putative oxidoreductase